MAYENLEPFREDILALRRPGPHQKTLIEVCDYLLEKHNLRTTPGTLSRYLKDLRQPLGVALREPSDPERERLEAISLLTEVLVEIRGRSDEQRAAIERLAGQIAINTGSIEEMEKTVAGLTRAGSEPDLRPLVRRIWLRALLGCSLVFAIAAALALWLLR